MSIITSILTGGTNNHATTSEEANQMRTDFISPGVVGGTTNTSGVAPMTGAFAVNAQGTPDKTVTVTLGGIYITATPAGQNSQLLRVSMNANQTLTISDNTSGSTRYDWIYVKIDPTAANNPALLADDVASIVVNRSTSNTTDTVGAPAYNQPIAKVTVTNGFTTIQNADILDMRGSAGTPIPAGSITADKFATNAIALGYAQITSDFTTTSATAVQITGLTTTVTVPAGGRRIKITVYTLSAWHSSTTTGALLSLWDGTVGSGTQLQTAAGFGNLAAGGATTTVNMVWVGTPAAGTKTYNVGLRVGGAGTATFQAGSTSPAFILVEAI